MSNSQLFHHCSSKETKTLLSFLRDETFGGVLLLIMTFLALVTANVPWSKEAYIDVKELVIGPASLQLNLSLHTWAADGLLAIFFFVAGLELKREFSGDLKNPQRAILPISAAFGGVVIPAFLYCAINYSSPDALKGWAIPTATDIAFALAILSILNNHLPNSLRTFLLTLAVVDDLIAIVIIAFFYTKTVHIEYLGLALIPLLLFGYLVHKRYQRWWLLLPLAFACWALVHASGIHATVAGVLLAFTVPVHRLDQDPHKPGLAEHFEHLTRPISAGIAVPIFAFMSAGFAIDGWEELSEALHHPITLGIIFALVGGKSLGIFSATYFVSKFTRAQLDPELKWLDIFGVSLLAGVGFTVSLLIGDLAFHDATEGKEYIKIAVLLGSFLAAMLAAIVLKSRDKHYRIIQEQEEAAISSDS